MKRKWSRGFTLMEMIITLGVMTILTTGMMLLLAPAMRTYSASMDMSQGKAIADSILELIRGELTYAADIEVSGGGTVKYVNPIYGNMTMSLSEGRLSITDVASPPLQYAYDEKFYIGKRISSLTFSQSGKTIEVKIAISDQSGRDLYQGAMVADLLNSG